MRAAKQNRKIGLLPATVAAVLLLATLAGAQAPDPLLQQADQALQKRDYVAAAQALETYLAKNSGDYRAEFNLAYAYSMTGRRADAISRYRNVLAREPGLLPARLNLGILLVESRQPEEAESHLRAVVEKDPENSTAILYLAETLAALQRSPDAGEAYERVLKLKPDDARAHWGYGKLLEQSNPALAEEHLRRAVQLDPSLEEASLQLASLLETRASGSAEPLSEAADIYRRFLDKHPERRELRVRLGEIYARQKQFSAAAGQFETARAAGDSSLPVAKELLQAYLNIPSNQSHEREGVDSTEKAIVLVQEILAQESGNAEMHLLYGRLRMEKKQYREAAEEFRRAAGLQPQSAEGFQNLASAFYLLGEYEATVGALAKISELKQDTAGTYFLRAICLDKLHLLKPALENYQSFLALSKGQNPDQEFQARQRSKTLLLDIKKGIGGRKK